MEHERHPDVSKIVRTIWDSNPHACTAFKEPIQIALELVATNWEEITLIKLHEHHYECDRFQGADRIVSPTFPELNLTVAQVLGA
jgi:hypothetical protein